MPQVSVIVPVYNVERYLPRCIDSILAQTYTDFELLLVDDGSPDGCGRICDEYAKKDRRIRVFHKKNGGQSDARNYGLDHMQGNYVTFVDSDDYVGENYLSILMEMITEGETDFSVLSFEQVYDLESIQFNDKDERHYYDGSEMYRIMVVGKITGTTVCGKLFRKELFDSIRFPVGKVYEDTDTIPYLVKREGSYSYSTSRQYFYLQRPGSTMNSISEKSIQMWLAMMERYINYTKERFPECMKYMKARLVSSVFWVVVDKLLWTDQYISVAKHIRRQYASFFADAWRLPGLTSKEKMKATLFLANIRLYRIIRKKWVLHNPEAMRKIPVSEMNK